MLTIAECRPLLAGEWRWTDGASGPDRLVEATQYGARVLWRESEGVTACTIEVIDTGTGLVLASTRGEGDCASEALDGALGNADSLLAVVGG